MKIDKGLNQYYIEYLFHMMLTKIRRDQNISLKVSHGRLLHDQVEAYLLSKYGSNMANGLASEKLLCEAFDMVMIENFGDRYQPLYIDVSESGDDFVMREGIVDSVRDFTRTQFYAAIGYNSGKSMSHIRKNPRFIGKERNLPVSPYDPRWSNRESILSLGHDMGRISVEQIDNRLGGDPALLLLQDGSSAGQSGAMDIDVLTVVDEDGGMRKVGPAATAFDVAGLTQLMPYIATKDFKELSAWVMQPASVGEGKIDRNKVMGQEAIARALAVLNELDSQGVEYVIEKDRRPGQLKARIKTTGLSVRITDTKTDERFVGRCYHNGVVINFTNSVMSDNTRHADYIPTPEETVDLLRLSQGKHIDGLGTGIWRNGSFTIPYKSIPWTNGETANIGVRFATGGFTDTLKFINGDEAAKAFLEDAISSARRNVETMIDLPGLVSAFEDNREAAIDGTYVPMFNGDTEIAGVQQAYWDVIRGAKQALLLPDVDEELYREKVASLSRMELDENQYQVAHNMLTGDLIFTGESTDRLSGVKAHMDYVLDNMVGTYEVVPRLGSDGNVRDLSFDPVRVSKFMDSERNQMSNIDNLINTMKIVGTDVDTLMGNNFQTRIIRDRMVSFDPTASRTFTPDGGLNGSHDSVQARALAIAWEALEDRGYKVNNMAIDDKGVVRYEADRNLFVRNKKQPSPVVGYLGQIFEPGELGTITTQFASGENYLFAPGYEAIVLKQKLGENLSVEERTLLRGYEQLMEEEIRSCIVADTLSVRPSIGTTSGLNRVYRRLYDTRHDVDFFEKVAEQGLTDEWQRAILETESRIVRYPNSIRDNSTINAAHNAKKRDVDLDNDAMNDPWGLTDGRNMSIMTEEGDGYFDPMMTASGTNQGITRYLVESAQVTSEGRIVPGDVNDRAPIAKLPDVKNMRFDPFDRQQMTYSNLLRAGSITPPVKTAMMTLGGWNADDPVIISRRFAENYGIRSKSGGMRSLKIGDKLSDFHGNKGVVSMIIDPEMDKDDPQNKGLEKLIDIFSDNPELDVVMSPFSAVSRYNGGTARDLMQDPDVLDLTSVGNGFVNGGMGSMQFIVTNMAVDSKTRVYSDDDLAQGKGRKASSQLAWALGAQDVSAVMAEMYGHNERSLADLKEYLIVMGLDISPTGDFRYGFDDLDASIEGETRIRHELPPLNEVVNDAGRLQIGEIRQKFISSIGNTGGDLVLPFPLVMPTNEKLRKVGNNEWALPIISSHLRRGQTLDDGATIVHDFTTQYERIFSNAIKYNFYQDKLASGKGSAKDLANWKDKMSELISDSQMNYNKICNEIRAQRFDNKHNIIKESIMGSRLPNSATCVWTSDPRLAIDEVAMPTTMAKTLGFKPEGDYALIWRDPILRDGGVRYMKVVINDDLTGVAINPAMDGSFDGDFDGDSVAVVRLQTKAAQEEAKAKLSIEANLLDFGSWREDDAEYELYMQNSLDTKVAQYRDPSLVDEFAELRHRANDAWIDFEESDKTEADRQVFLERSRAVKDELTDYYHRAWENEYGNAVLQFDNIEHHMQSVIESCVDTGAKGSLSKIEAYARYLGAKATSDLELGEKRTFVDLGVPQVTREDHTGVQMATAIKSFGTGVAGKFSQRGVRLLRNHGLKAVTELTYPATQSILQAKHDPEDAAIKYDALMGAARDLWRGRKLKRYSSGDHVSWDTVRENGEYVMATPEEWIAQFKDIYTDPHGLGVSINPEYIDEIAKHMSKDGLMVGVEIGSQPYDGTYESIDFSEILAAPMDVLAYDGKFEMYIDAAKQGVNLYEGKRNEYFQPNLVTRNKERQAAFDNEDTLDIETMEAIGAADTREGYVARQPRNSTLAVPVGHKLKLKPVVAAPVVDNSADDFDF